MFPISEEKLVLVEDGESIPLGERELKAIHTPGHDPNHLCFLDTKSRGLFCGDALGAYFSDIKVSIPSSVSGSDPTLTLHSIDKCQRLNPAIGWLHFTRASFATGAGGVGEIRNFL